MKILTVVLTMLLTGIEFVEAKGFDEFNCLSRTVYFEARGEPVPGQFAVASVVMNRVRSKLYPQTVCSVVHQPYQFSWTLLKNLQIKDINAWRDAQHVAWIVLNAGLKSNVGRSMDYHSVEVNPHWASHYVKAIVIGNHIFYDREKS